jgi:hypothetical protein
MSSYSSSSLNLLLSPNEPASKQSELKKGIKGWVGREWGLMRSDSRSATWGLSTRNPGSAACSPCTPTLCLRKKQNSDAHGASPHLSRGTPYPSRGRTSPLQGFTSLVQGPYHTPPRCTPQSSRGRSSPLHGAHHNPPGCTPSSSRRRRGRPALSSRKIVCLWEVELKRRKHLCFSQEMFSD